ncbi:MAG: fibronectin type III domain-containing protein [Actinomycetota bacterium]
MRRRRFFTSIWVMTSMCAAMFLGWSGTVQAVSNDDRVNASVISGSSGSVSGSLVGTKNENASYDVWYRWKSPAAGHFEFDVTAVENTKLYVEGGQTKARDSDSGPKTDPAVEFQAILGVEYYIAVESELDVAPTGNFLLRWRPVPLNDEFRSPQTISGLTGSLAGDNRGATTEVSEPLDSYNYPGDARDHRSGSLWYSWTPTTSGIADVRFAYTNPPTTMQRSLVRAYIGDTLPTLTEQRSTGCYYSPAPETPNSGAMKCDQLTRFAVTAGTTYRVVVAAVLDYTFYGMYETRELDLGTFELLWTVTPRSNDMFSQAPFVGGGSGSLPGTTELATSESGEPRPNNTAATGTDQYSSVWFRWTAYSSAAIAFSVQAGWQSCLDPGWVSSAPPYEQVAAYTGSSIGNLVAVAQGDTAGQGAVFIPQVGQTYYIQVGNVSCGHPITLSWGSARPSPPANLSGSVSPGQVHLAWAPSPFSDSYNVYRSSTLGETVLLATVIGSSTSYDDTSIVDGVHYFYLVSGVNEWGEGLRSAKIQVPIGIPEPASLTSTSLGARGIELAWSVPFDGGSPITGFRIYRSTTSGSETFLAAVSNVTTYTDVSLTDLATYYYRVSAVNVLGEGPLSNESSAVAQLTAPAAPVIDSPVQGSLNRRIVVISGTAEAGTTVKVYFSSGFSVGPVTTNGQGNWTTSPSLGSATYSIHAVAIAVNGNTSSPSPVRTFQVDAISPSVTLRNSNGSPVSQATPLVGSASDAQDVARITISFQDLSGKSVGEFVICTCPGKSFDWSHYPAVAPGTYMVQVQAQDLAGNVGRSGTIRIVKA